MSGSGAAKEDQPGMVPRPRIQALSDLIFGLALSISALILVGHQPATTEQVVFAITLYLLSFLILISVWRLYSAVSSVLPSETAILTDLNVVLLFFVSIEPYLLNELFVSEGDLNAFVSGFYSIDLLAMFLILGYFMTALLDEKKQLISKTVVRKWRFERNVTLMVALIFAVSLVPYFGTTTVFVSSIGSSSVNFSLRSTCWLLALAAGWAGRAIAQTVKR